MEELEAEDEEEEAASDDGDDDDDVAASPGSRKRKRPSSKVREQGAGSSCCRPAHAMCTPDMRAAVAAATCHVPGGAQAGIASQDARSIWRRQGGHNGAVVGWRHAHGALRLQRQGHPAAGLPRVHTASSRTTGAPGRSPTHGRMLFARCRRVASHAASSITPCCAVAAAAARAQDGSTPAGMLFGRPSDAGATPSPLPASTPMTATPDSAAKAALQGALNVTPSAADAGKAGAFARVLGTAAATRMQRMHGCVRRPRRLQQHACSSSHKRAPASCSAAACVCRAAAGAGRAGERRRRGGSLCVTHGRALPLPAPQQVSQAALQARTTPPRCHSQRAASRVRARTLRACLAVRPLPPPRHASPRPPPRVAARSQDPRPGGPPPRRPALQPTQPGHPRGLVQGRQGV